MRKTVARWICLMACLLAGMALADAPEGRINPDRETVMQHSVVEETKPYLRASKLSLPGVLGASVLAAEAPLEISLKRYTKADYGVQGLWQAVPNNEGSYLYEFYFGEWESADFGNSWVIFNQKKSSDNYFHCCDIAAPGVYRLMVNVYDADAPSTRLLQRSYKFTYEEDVEHPSLETLAAQIVAQERGADDYETALNLYDWVTHHMYYDYSRKYYGADGALVRGYGVCDSYSKGYYLLLKAAGIDRGRISSSNHAWNTICFDGQWYQTDATWDDNAPDTCTDAVSGMEGHEYFCVTDELMLKSGHSYTLSGTRPCDSLAMNYFVRCGGWDSWNTSFIEPLTARLAAGAHAHAMYVTGETRRHLKILAWILTEQPQWTEQQSQGASWDFQFNFDTGVFTVAEIDGREYALPYLIKQVDLGVEISGYLGTAANLTLPETLNGMTVTGIEASAFLNLNTLESVVLPENLTSIGTDAFNGCSILQEMVLPENLQVIGARAFLNCPAVSSMAFPEGITQIGEDVIPEGRAFECGYTCPLAHALGVLDIPFTDPQIPDWHWMWTYVGEEELLTAVGCDSDETWLQLPEPLALLRDLGNAEPKVLIAQTDSVRISDSFEIPASLICIMATSRSEDLIAWGEAHPVYVLQRDLRTVLPEMLLEIESEAFSGTALHWVVIPNGANVHAQAFSGADKLTAVTLPPRIQNLDLSAFTGMDILVLAPAGSVSLTLAAWTGMDVLAIPKEYQ